MGQLILTTKTGSLEQIELYRYDFTQGILSDKEKYQKLSYWLDKQSEFELYSQDQSGFYSFNELKPGFTSQYQFSGKTIIKQPYQNTSLISNYVGRSLRNQLEKKYKRFLNQNTYIVNTIKLTPFHLHKCFEFNIEVFQNGEYFIHVFPLSKITSDISPVTAFYLGQLKTGNKNNSNTNEMQFSLISMDRFNRTKLDLLSKDYSSMISELFTTQINRIATYDYHFVANYDPVIFGKITEYTFKSIGEIQQFIDPILSNFFLPAAFKLSSENYVSSDIQDCSKMNNLLVGLQQSEMITIHSKSPTRYGLRVEYTRDSIARDELITIFIKKDHLIEELLKHNVPLTVQAKVEQQEGWQKPYIQGIFPNNGEKHFATHNQSASYYNGIYKPANHRVILPLIIGDLNIDLFYELVARFNKHGIEVKITEPYVIGNTESIQIDEITRRIGSKKNKSLIVILSKYTQPLDFTNPLKGYKYQTFQGSIDNSTTSRAKLSNFVCKCLEKLGGIIAVIKETDLDCEGYFIGLDLGHTTVASERYSNLAMAIFDNRGILKGKALVEKIPRMENLTEFPCKEAFEKLSKILQKDRSPAPKHIVIHRDGKLHRSDIEILLKTAGEVWPSLKIDIVEVIKSGFPLMFLKGIDSSITNPTTGVYFQNLQQKYAILTTNTQNTEKDGVVNPIIVRHRYGTLDFQKIINQVYWLTRIYTNNLFNSTRLPATTLKANNIVSTSNKIHKSTYKG